jgi:predicted RecA/RadA family phage recombinase
MKATYWQRGETLEYVNNTASVIEANTIITLVSRIGVAGTDIAVGATGTVHVAGVFEVDKAASEAIPMGTLVYFNGSAITATATSNTPAGYAANEAVAADAKILVKLLG